MNNPIWLRNIDAFSAVNPEAALLLEKTAVPVQQVRIEKAQDGSPVLCVLHSNQVVPLDHHQQPVKHAQDWVLNLGEELFGEWACNACWDRVRIPFAAAI